MARIAYLSIGMGSTVHGSLEACRRLQAAGHELTLVSHVDLAADAAAVNLAFRRLSADTKSLALARQLTEQRNQQRRSPLSWWRWWTSLQRLRGDSLQLAELKALYRTLSPDLILADVECHCAIVAALAERMPCATISFFFDVRLHPKIPHLSSASAPPVTGWQRLRIRLSHWALRASALRWRWGDRFGRAVLRRRMLPVRYNTVSDGDLRALGAACGLAGHQWLDRRHWLRPGIYPKLPMLCLNLASLDYRPPAAEREPEPALTYVGPMINDRRAEERLSEASNRQLVAFLGDRPNAPLIYCGLGTYYDKHASLLPRVVAAFQRRSDWSLVVGLGGFPPPSGLDPSTLPKNVLLLPWAPQLELLKIAAVAICHGGISTINECVWTRTPMLFYCGGEIDQPGDVARLVHHGLGVAGDPRQDSARQIELRIDALLSDDSVSQRLDHSARQASAMVAEQVFEKAVARLLRESVDEPGAPAPGT